MTVEKTLFQLAEKAEQELEKALAACPKEGWALLYSVQMFLYRFKECAAALESAGLLGLGGRAVNAGSVMENAASSVPCAHTGDGRMVATPGGSAPDLPTRRGVPNGRLRDAGDVISCPATAGHLEGEGI